LFKLVQLFGCPVDSDVIRHINPAQMLWYAQMFNQERKEEFDSELNIIEYLASFINYEAVRATKDAREGQKVVSDEDFEEQLRKQFGRDLSPEVLSTASRAETVSQEELKPKEVKKKGMIDLSDIKRYTGLELDDVKFHPLKK
jgi:hypothetical protein